VQLPKSGTSSSTPLCGGRPEVFLIRCQPSIDRVGPPDLLKPGWDLGVVEIGMVAAAGADQLEYAGVAAFGAAINDAGWLAPQDRCLAVAGLARKRRCQGGIGVNAQPWVPRMVGLGQRVAAGRAAGWPAAGHGFRFSVMHSPPSAIFGCGLIASTGSACWPASCHTAQAPGETVRRARALLTVVKTGIRWSRRVIRSNFATGGCGAIRP
jgi:hypothetical protein